ncbi:MAG: LCP family protein [Solirubrobacteraceae bacterium]
MGKRFALGALIITLLTAGATATATLLEISDNVSIIEKGEKIPDIEGVLDDVDSGEPQTILLLGSDQRYVDRNDKDAARSDTILLVRLDPSKEATAVLSIPRDLMVDIPGYGRAKINEAYSLGGPRKTVETVRALLDFPINHVVNVNFGGFRDAVDRLGCVYADVDRRYFNDNNPPVESVTNYATIDIAPGYQKLCGSDALDYVRFRHLDTDFVRAARQQEFLRQAKAQFGLGKLFDSRKQLLRIFARYTQTDIRSTPAILRLLKLAFESASNPIRQVRFRGDIAGDEALSFVEVTEENLRRTRTEFLDPKVTREAHGSARRGEATRPGRLAKGMVADRAGGLSRVTGVRKKARFPVYYPGHRLAEGSYVDESPRVYGLRDRRGARHRAYRIVVDAGEDLGQYYGVQGTTWTDAPILADPSEKRVVDGRKLELFYDGRRLRMVALRTRSAVYWVANTLSSTLSNAQMLDLAASLRRVGG